MKFQSRAPLTAKRTGGRLLCGSLLKLCGSLRLNLFYIVDSEGFIDLDEMTVKMNKN
jgi:hypothetical protein